MDETHDTYAGARRFLPGLAGQLQRREQGWQAVAAFCLLAFAGREVMHSMQLASVKTAQGAPRVLQANCDGTVDEVRLVPASEYRMADGLVFHRLESVVRCMRGLEGTTQQVADCWSDIRPLFRGEAAKRSNEDAAKLLGKNAGELQLKIEREPVRIERMPGNRKTLEGGFGLSWHESGRRDGKVLDESWSGVFTVVLSNVDDESGGMTNMDYTWEQDR